MKRIIRFCAQALVVFSICFNSSTFAQWSSPVNISPNSINAQMNENMGPCIAVSGDTIHVIWSDNTSMGYAIYYTRSVDTGHTWSPPVAITDTLGNAGMPSIAVSGSNIHVVWWDSLDQPSAGNQYGTLFGNSSFYEHSTDGGNTWGAIVCIDSNTIFWPGVAVSGSTVLVSLNKGAFDSTFVLLTISTDNGTTFGPEQTISTRTGAGRSKDPATATDGKNIHMSWNDNRCDPGVNDTMQIYYRRSTDMGQTWDDEVALTNCDHNSYTTMVCLDSSYVDVAHGENNDSWLTESSDSGTQLNFDEYVTGNGKYPFMVRKEQDLHVVLHCGNDSIIYIHSGDGGATWDDKVFLASVNRNDFVVPFIALTCPVLHVVWPDSGAIYYARNPTGNPSCPSYATGIANAEPSNTAFSIYPNPANGKFTVAYSKDLSGATLSLTDLAGRIVWSTTLTEISGTETINAETLGSGVYIWTANGDKGVYEHGKIVLIKP